MYSVSAEFLDAIRTGGGARYGYIEAYTGSTKITLPDGSTRLPLKADGRNEIAVDGSTPGVRRTLTATVAKTPGLWDLLAPTGTELRAYTVIRYPSGATETVPQGVFVVDSQQLDYTPSGDLSITAPDRWVRIQRARFLVPRASSASFTLRQQIAALITEVVGGSVTDTGTSTATVGAQSEDRDRAGWIQKMTTAGSLDVFFDRSGNPVIRDAPVLQASGVWSVDAGPGGVLVSANRQRDRQRTRNIVVVHGTANNGTAPFAPQAVWDNNPSSPTFAGGGSGSGAVSTVPAASGAGPFGQVPFFYSSPLLATTAQAIAAGQTLLAKMTGLNAQVNAASVPNVALDDGDTITVIFPRERWDLKRATERHLVETLTVPLVWHKNPLQIGTRSTVADIPEA